MGGKNLSNISIAVVRRLPKYHRYLKDLLDKEVYRISSKELGKLIGFTASQIRQDLNCFGGFGQQGYGYNVEELYKEISRILGLNKNYNIIIIGAGNLGQAIANYTGFGKLGFELLALFDIDPRLIGMKIKGIPVLNMDKLDEFISEHGVDIAIVCAPKDFAQEITDKLNKKNVRGIWNFAPADLNVAEGIIVENVNLSESLLTLSYLLNEKELLSG
ncbi:MAG: redox-sensing transcriptional repressor Rex [Natronincolaceae bacterium]|jgi:redox-sensing transcriptional repressor|nr:redox-sensing transcriptional repressor Rex [Bacillota bacterium]NLK90880.1 redox-sensing transcriptional repressor Rex [Clostridiales bacterium]